MRVLVTGGAGFIGSHVVELLVSEGHEVLVADRLTYAGRLKNLQAVLGKVELLVGNLAEAAFAERCARTAPQWVVHLAAETHVDSSLKDAGPFIDANVMGTARLLQAMAGRWVDGQTRHGEHRTVPQKIVVLSTDEVYGPTPKGALFDESSPCRPSNPYSASKVGVEALVHAARVASGLPLVLARPCNTYGPRQHPEKFIPKCIELMLAGETVTIYNDGRGARDWLHAHDHATALLRLLEAGQPGETYNIAAGCEVADFDIFATIRDLLLDHGLIDNVPQHTYVPGRPGHDARYWMDGSKLRAVGWEPRVPFYDGMASTVLWHVAHPEWFDSDLVPGSHLGAVDLEASA